VVESAGGMTGFVGFRLPVALVQRLDELAAAAGTSRSEVLRGFLARASARPDPMSRSEELRAFVTRASARPGAASDHPPGGLAAVK
jgi:predicted transcriptional regulator